MHFDKLQLEGDEEVLFQTRRHWFIPFSRLFIISLVAATPLLLFILALATPLQEHILLLTSTNPALLVYGYAVYVLLLFMEAFNVWTNYYLDMFILTNFRLILVNQKGLFRRNIASFRLERLQDMNSEINGVIATLLNFGRLEIETAGHSDEEFEAYGLPDPKTLKSRILKAADELIETYQDRPRLAHDGT